MNDPESYQHASINPRYITLSTLQIYINKVTWKTKAKILDIGCADGSLTNNILKPHVPQDYEKLVGCDFNETMVNAANKYADERTTFIMLDIVKPLPDGFRSQFDFVFSSITFHWIPQQELAFKNVYAALAENGTCLLNFYGRHSTYNVWRCLSKTNKWSAWLKNVEMYTSPYSKTKDPRSEIVNMMKQIGFKNIEVTCEERNYKHVNEKVLKTLIKAVNPFDIPPNIFDEYVEDFLNEFRRMDLKVKNNNQVEITTIEYDLITVFANK